MFTYFTDRDGKFQLKSLAESSFDPLSRTCRVHADGRGAPHVRGDTGIGRSLNGRLKVMKEFEDG